MASVQEKEWLFLAAILSSQNRFLVGSSLVEPDALSVNNAVIYKAARELFNNGATVGYDTVAYALNESGMLANVGGLDFLQELRTMGFEFDNVTFQRLCEDLARIGHTRRIKRVCNSIIEEEDTANPEDLAGKLIHGVYKTATANREGFQSLQEIMDSNPPERIPMLSTTLAGLDMISGGFYKNDFNIVAGRPSMGKSAYALQVAGFSGLVGLGTAIFSLEMSKASVSSRLQKVYDPSYIRDAPIYINADSTLTVDRIIYDTTMLKLTRNISVVVVDYIQLIKGQRRGENKNDFVTRISSGLQDMSRRMDITLIALSQLSRDCDKESREPMLSDLRDSGSLEQDADVIMFVHRPGKRENGKIIIAKNREGKIGAAPIKFDGEQQRFSDP